MTMSQPQRPNVRCTRRRCMHQVSRQISIGEDGRGEYLDYYAAHRMTEDAHVRLYADGGFALLATPSLTSRGGNSALAADLARKGFDTDLIGLPTE